MSLNKNQLIEYRKYMAEKMEKAVKEDHLIYGSMFYQCKCCGRVYIINLEKGSEDSIDDAEPRNNEPVPFSIVCPVCGNLAYEY